MDTGTGLTILGSALGGGKIIEKILGPTAKYLGEQMKELAVKKIENITNIFKNAEQKLGDKINNQGGVPPKILKSILEDGAWCEETLQVEYFGGVLASSRTGISRDDRGVYFTSLISRLSTYQIRSHFVFYHIIKKLFNGQDININEGSKWSELRTFIPYNTFFDAMEFTSEEFSQLWNLLSHTIFGLDKEELIKNFRWGNKDSIINDFPQVETDGILLNPTKLGIELFMWAYGYGQYNMNDFFLPDIQFSIATNIRIGEAVSIKKVQSESSERN